MSDVLCVLVALVAGACAPAQAGINSQLRLWTGDPVSASMISFAVGTIVLLLYMITTVIPWPDIKTASKLPLWVWTGGALGAFIVVVSVILAPKLGAGALMGTMITGQLIGGILLDHFGLIGYSVHPVNGWRFLGVALLISGVVIIKRF